MIIFQPSWWQTNKNDWYLMLLALGSLAFSGLLFYFIGLGNPRDFFAGSFLVSVFFITGHRLIRANLNPADRWMFPMAAMLISLGLIFNYRLSSQHFLRHTFYLLAGLAICIALSRADYRRFLNYFWVLGAAGIILLGITAVFGRQVHGAKNWLETGILVWQPSELVKVFLILSSAAFISEGRRLYLVHLIWLAGIVFLVLQKDLGTAFIFFGVWLSMAFAAKEKGKILAAVLGAGFLGALAAFKIFPHLEVRMTAWLHPWDDPTGAGYQILQALAAYQAGGLTGAGLGVGQCLLIPAVTTDFIFAAIGEEMGLLGTAAVLTMFILLVVKIFGIAARSEDLIDSMTALGIAVMIGLQVLVISGGVVKLIPLTGVTLPFISYGGSSLISILLMMGLVFNIASRPQG